MRSLNLSGQEVSICGLLMAPAESRNVRNKLFVNKLLSDNIGCGIYDQAI